MIYSLYIINKAGGLVYQKDFNDGLAKLSSNEYLVLAGTFHGVHAITSKISPLPNSSGIEILEAENFKLHCFQSLTGTKFLLITDLPHPNVEQALRRIYDIYGDFVMKNPFHTPEMPIRSEMFDLNLQKLIKNVGSG
ncbi:Sybindin-like protein [Jimgerdemannia flammicorona]|uniref:Sybindin-like protein n=2 Tax=Jimgerdemannia flammicorona TaxID=994334 RepID=A0A433DM04_9FUNG|nr:Sybindin-like protein [Jimgerdemannia flammicorona]RUS23917.1 Sybindin-like protein [Jimgerdemannia flammicorona]